MQIQEFAQTTNLPASMVRFCEEIGLLPHPKKHDDGYRDYKTSDIERAKFISTAHSLGFSLADIKEILAIQEQQAAPRRDILDLMINKVDEISLRIVELQKLEAQLRELHQLSVAFPKNSANGQF